MKKINTNEEKNGALNALENLYKEVATIESRINVALKSYDEIDKEKIDKYDMSDNHDNLIRREIINEVEKIIESNMSTVKD